MENSQQFNNFDALLKQSLQSAQMPVPQGVWEAVGTSIGTKAVVLAKASTIKLLIIKAVSAVVVSGAVVFGVYKFATKENIIPQKTDNIEVITSDSQMISASPIEMPPTTDLKNQHIQLFIQDSVYTENTTPHRVTDSIPIKNPFKDTSNQKLIDLAITQSSENGKSKPKPETPKILEPFKKKQIADENPIIESDNSGDKFSAQDILIPDVFTPYEQDGYNDCYRIIIENESKFLLQIFDPRGNKVFETLDKSNCWDGKNMNTGQMCPKGYYVFKCMYELKTGFKKTERGELNIL